MDAGTSDFYRTQAAVFELTSILGHELQHAVEISQATTPMKGVTDFEWYCRGIGVPGSATLDTLAARQMGALVGNELRGMHTPRPTAVLRSTQTTHADELRTLMHQHLAGDL